MDNLKLMRTLDPKAIREMLKLYRVSNCLWDQTDLLYCNKDARTEAWSKILKKMKEYHPDISVDLIKRKLDNMRTAYKREVKKIIAGCQSGEGYRTTLWYFDLMSFLDGGTVPAQNSRVEDAEEDENDENQVDNDNDENENDDSHGGADTDSMFPTYYAEYLEDEQEPKPKKSRKSQSYSVKQIKQEDQDTSNPNISSVYLTSPDNEDPMLFSEPNEALAYGKAVGLQLKELEGLQRIIAEKLISDTIFHARLNKLTPHSTIQLNSD